MATVEIFDHNIVIAIAEAQATIVALSALFRQPTSEPPFGPTPVSNQRIDLSGIPTAETIGRSALIRVQLE